MDQSLLQITKLQVSFKQANQKLTVVRGYDLDIKEGEIIGIVGESGSGKTVSLSGALGLFSKEEADVKAESIWFEGLELTEIKEKAFDRLHGKHIGFIFQNASSSLNPYKKVGKQIQDVLRLHKIVFSKASILESLEEVGIEDPERVYDMFPFQLSGGQNQRVMIARSVLLRPKLLIADEPTSSIDADNKDRILKLLSTLCEKYDMALLMITHDFEAAEQICEKLYVMYGGMIVEYGHGKTLMEEPTHPYTYGLMRCAKSLKEHEEVLYTLPGVPLVPTEYKNRCPFLERCNRKIQPCHESIPAKVQTTSGYTRCFNPLTYESEQEERRTYEYIDSTS
jgi:oligopeptide/dipeptide ABC transporter ATP-binding protein